MRKVPGTLTTHTKNTNATKNWAKDLHRHLTKKDIRTSTQRLQRRPPHHENANENRGTAPVRTARGGPTVPSAHSTQCPQRPVPTVPAVPTAPSSCVNTGPSELTWAAASVARAAPLEDSPAVSYQTNLLLHTTQQSQLHDILRSSPGDCKQVQGLGGWEEGGAAGRSTVDFSAGKILRMSGYFHCNRSVSTYILPNP